MVASDGKIDVNPQVNMDASGVRIVASGVRVDVSGIGVHIDCYKTSLALTDAMLRSACWVMRYSTNGK